MAKIPCDFDNSSKIKSSTISVTTDAEGFGRISGLNILSAYVDDLWNNPLVLMKRVGVNITYFKEYITSQGTLGGLSPNTIYSVTYTYIE